MLRHRVCWPALELRLPGVTATSHLHDPQALYRNWEHEQWNPWSINLATDRE
jgi:hypothetical protein